MTPTVNGIAFAVLSICLVGGALGMLHTKNIMHAGFWLLELSVAAAGVYLLLDADYLALLQLMVYSGAVSVLVIFSILVVLRRREDAVRPHRFSWPAALASLVFGAAMVVLVCVTPYALAALPDHVPGIAELGQILFAPEGWVLPFELASLLLTAALVGAVWWAGRDREEEEDR